MRLVVLLVVCICRCLFGGRGFTVVWFVCSCCLVGGFSGCYCGWRRVVVACCGGVVIDLLDDTLFVADFIRCVLGFIYFMMVGQIWFGFGWFGTRVWGGFSVVVFGLQVLFGYSGLGFDVADDFVLYCNECGFEFGYYDCGVGVL